jgi:hypothetical protein|tara:strand:- start:62 stop:238 length:177 start_codon:yes stop_codon:yes gene_type:complete
MKSNKTGNYLIVCPKCDKDFDCSSEINKWKLDMLETIEILMLIDKITNNRYKKKEVEK